MKRFVYAIFALLLFTGSVAHAQTCGRDTLQYIFLKSIVNNQPQIRALILLPEPNVVQGQIGASQWYEAPGALTLHGFEFLAVTNGPGATTATLAASVFLAGPDSLPAGSALATVNVTVDTSQTNARRYANFATPVSIAAGSNFLLVVENLSATNDTVALFATGAGRGLGEYRANAVFKAPGVGIIDVRGYDLTVGGQPFNSDWLMSPIVEYSLTGPGLSLLPSATVCAGDSIVVTAAGNPFVNSLVYNPAFPGTTIIVNPGNQRFNAPIVSGVLPVGSYTFTAVDSLQTWSNFLRQIPTFCTTTGINSVSLTVSALPTAPTITLVNGDELTIPATADNIQWLLAGAPIGGANSTSYFPTQNGTYSVEITNAAGCSITSAPFNFVEPGFVCHTGVTFQFNLQADICDTAVAITLSALPAGGSFSGQGVSGTTFNPAGLPAGNITINYNVTTSPGCDTTISRVINVRSCPIVCHAGITFSFDLPATICDTAAAIALSAVPSGGTFSGAGVTAGVFNPNGLPAGATTINYSVTTRPGCDTVITRTIEVEDCNNVGVGNTLAPGSVRIYPNPAQAGVVTIDNLLREGTLTTWRISALTGQVMLGGDLTARTQTVSIAELPAGIYLLTISGPAGQLTEKLIVR
jgi:hypothetical protein